jgi:hypothetical protein
MKQVSRVSYIVRDMKSSLNRLPSFLQFCLPCSPSSISNRLFSWLIFQKRHNCRAIKYSVTTRNFFAKSSKDYDAKVEDVATGETAERTHCSTKEGAMDRAIEDLFKQLREKKFI